VAEERRGFCAFCGRALQPGDEVAKRAYVNTRRGEFWIFGDRVVSEVKEGEAAEFAHKACAEGD
jgi:hypothetical protein